MTRRPPCTPVLRPESTGTHGCVIHVVCCVGLWARRPRRHDRRPWRHASFRFLFIIVQFFPGFFFSSYLTTSPFGLCLCARESCCSVPHFPPPLPSSSSCLLLLLLPFPLLVPAPPPPPFLFSPSSSTSTSPCCCFFFAIGAVGKSALSPPPRACSSSSLSFSSSCPLLLFLLVECPLSSPAAVFCLLSPPPPSSPPLLGDSRDEAGQILSRKVFASSPHSSSSPPMSIPHNSRQKSNLFWCADSSPACTCRQRVHPRLQG